MDNQKLNLPSLEAFIRENHGLDEVIACLHEVYYRFTEYSLVLCYESDHTVSDEMIRCRNWLEALKNLFEAMKEELEKVENGKWRVENENQ